MEYINENIVEEKQNLGPLERLKTSYDATQIRAWRLTQNFPKMGFVFLFKTFGVKVERRNF